MLNVTLVLSTLSIYLGFITKVLDDNSCYSAIKTHHQITIATFVRFIYGMYKGKFIVFFVSMYREIYLRKNLFPKLQSLVKHIYQLDKKNIEPCTSTIAELFWILKLKILKKMTSLKCSLKNSHNEKFFHVSTQI